MRDKPTDGASIIGSWLNSRAYSAAHISAYAHNHATASRPPRYSPAQPERIYTFSWLLRSTLSFRTQGPLASVCVQIRLRPDPVGAHHLVVLVLDDVAVPHVQAGEVELGLDPGDLLRVGDDGV